MSTSEHALIPVGTDVYIPDNLEQVLDAFYKKVNPDKHTNIPAIMQKYKGKEFVLFNKLLKIYGEDPWPRNSPSAGSSNKPDGSVEKEAQLGEKISTTRDELIESVTKEVAILKHKVDSSEKAILQRDEEIKKYQRQLDESFQRLEELELALDSERKENSEQVQRLHTSIADLSSSRDVLQNSYDQQCLEVDKLRSSLEAKDAEIQQLQSQLEAKPSVEAPEAVETEMASLREAAKKKEEELQKISEEVKAKEDELKKKEDELEKKKEELKSKAVELETKEEELKAKNDELASAKESLTAAESELTSCREEVAALQKANKTLQDKAQTTSEQLASKKKLYDSLAASEIQNLKKSLSAVEEERDGLEKSNSDLTLEVQRLQHELEKKKEEKVSTGEVELSRHLEEVMKRNEELEIQIITQQKENEAKEAQLSSQLAESQNTISELNEKSKALGDSISRMTVELAKKEEASQSSVSELEALKGELEEAKSAKGAIQAEMVEKEKILAETTEEHIMLQGVVKGIQEELGKYKEEQGVLQSKYDQVLSDNDTLRQENESLKRDMKETKEQLADDLIRRLQTDSSEEKKVSIPTISTQIDASAFTLKSFLEFSESILSEGVLSTVDLEKQITGDNLKQIQGLLLDRVVTILSIVSNGIQKQEWKKSEDCTSCHNCHAQFSFFSRKHHCRCCGNVFCSKCSNKYVTFPGAQQAERVCDDCFIVFDRLNGYITSAPNQ